MIIITESEASAIELRQMNHDDVRYLNSHIEFYEGVFTFSVEGEIVTYLKTAVDSIRIVCGYSNEAPRLGAYMFSIHSIHNEEIIQIGEDLHLPFQSNEYFHPTCLDSTSQRRILKFLEAHLDKLSEPNTKRIQDALIALTPRDKHIATKLKFAKLSSGADSTEL